jgi:hypothetical protein
MYFKDNPGELIHLHCMRWYTGARHQTHSQIVSQGWQSPAPGTTLVTPSPCLTAVEQVVYS